MKINSYRKWLVQLLTVLMAVSFSASGLADETVSGINPDRFEFIEKDGRKLVQVPLALVLQLLVDRSSTIRSGLLDQAIAESNLVSEQESRSARLTASISTSQSSTITSSDVDNDDDATSYLTFYETASQTLSSTLSKTDFNGISYSMTLKNSTSQSSHYSVDNQGDDSEDLGTTDAPVSSTSVTFGVEIPIFQDWGDVNKVDLYQREIEVDQADLTFHFTRQQLIEQVAGQYWEIVGLWQNKASLAKAVDISEDLLKENLEKVELGLLTPIDAKESEIQLLKNRQSWTSNNKQILEAEDSLKLLLDLEEFPYGFYPGDLPTSTEITRSDSELMELIFNHSTELATIEKTRESNHWDRQQALNKDQSNLDLSLSYTVNGAGDSVSSSTGGFSDQNLSGYNVSLSWTMPFSNRQTEEEIHRSKLEQAKLQLQLNDQKLSLRNDLKTIKRDLDFYRKNIKSNQAQLSLTEEVLQEEIKKLQVGRGRVSNVSEAQQDVIEAKESLIRAYIDYELSYLSLLVKTGDVYKKYQLYPFTKKS